MKNIKNYNIKENELHPFHLVRPSPWPITSAFSLFFLVFGLVKYLHSLDNALIYIHFGTLTLTYCMYNWFRDITYEATFEGHHTRKVQQGLRIGMVLFIVSEVMFFFSFFFAFFHASLSPSI
jgi:cytochrome c oxidase subunit 3